MQEGKKVMGKFERQEAEKRDAERAKNDLEAYIISTGGFLDDGAYNEVACSLFCFPLLPYLGLQVSSAGSVGQRSLTECTPADWLESSVRFDACSHRCTGHKLLLG